MEQMVCKSCAYIVFTEQVERSIHLYREKSRQLTDVSVNFAPFILDFEKCVINEGWEFIDCSKISNELCYSDSIDYLVDSWAVEFVGKNSQILDQTGSTQE
jgi:hypothetical protein